MTALSAVVGMLLGAITVVVWSNLSGGIFDLYEIVPGFLLSSLAIVGISLLRPEAKLRTLAQFDAAARLTAES
jgi:sodium/proline symporter